MSESTDRATRQPTDFLGPLISTVLFGYYGFLAGLDTHGSAGEPIALWIAFVWSLRISAVLFAICLVLAARGNPRELLWYGISGAIATAGLAAVLVWDFADPNALAVSPFILLIFVAWNGYSSFATIRDALR